MKETCAFVRRVYLYNKRAEKNIESISNENKNGDHQGTTRNTAPEVGG